MIKRYNFIILGSTGRNTGKTEFACRLIKRYAGKHKIYGVKVVSIDPREGNCPRGGKGCGICTSLKGDYEIVEEKKLDPAKDTSRMLMSGAQKSFFLKVNMHSLEKGLKALLQQIPDDALAVCESNSIRKVIDPGLFLVIRNINEKRIKESCSEVMHYADRIIDFQNMTWDTDPGRIVIENNKWILREKATAIVLAGGRSSRMEGLDKSLLPIRGEPMIAAIVKQLMPHFEEILIGANDKIKYGFLGLPVINDIEPGRGPLMGIYSCLKASSNDISFFTACDIPDMNIRLIHRMINMAGDVDIVMPVTSTGKHEPLYAVYRKTVIPLAEMILRDKGGSRIVELLKRATVRFISFDEGGWYRNLNMKDDYNRYIENEKRRKCSKEHKGNNTAHLLL